MAYLVDIRGTMPDPDAAIYLAEIDAAEKVGDEKAAQAYRKCLADGIALCACCGQPVNNGDYHGRGFGRCSER